MTTFPRIPAPVFLAFLVLPPGVSGQRPPGHPIGRVETVGNLIHLELDEDAVAPARLFDLDHRTLRFTPEGGGYTVENVPLVWDDELGQEMSAAAATLEGFAFPFSGREWRELEVGTGSITFGAGQGEAGRGRGRDPVGNRTGAGFRGRAGFQMERYPELRTVGRTFVGMAPGIAAFVKPNLRGQRYWKELPDRVFPTVDAGVVRDLGTVGDGEDAGVAPHLDVERVRLTAVDGLFLEATLETRGAARPEGDPGGSRMRKDIASTRARRRSSPSRTSSPPWGPGSRISSTPGRRSTRPSSS